MPDDINPNIDATEAFGLDIPWTAQDADALRSFLATTTGKRVLGQLFFRTPNCAERSDPFKRGIQSGVQEGYKEAVHALGHLCNSAKSVKP